MRQDTLVAIVAILAGVAVVTVVFESGSSGDGSWSGGSSGSWEEETIKYDPELLKRYPREAFPITKPQSWLTTEDYPAAAVHNEFEGVLRFRLIVDQYGEVANCRLLQSSGAAVFDRRACEAISTRARFFPALDDNQDEVKGTYNSTVIWAFDDTFENGLQLAEAVFGKNGTLASCEWRDEPAPPADPMPVCRNEIEQLKSLGIDPLSRTEDNLLVLLVSADEVNAISATAEAGP